MSTKTTVELTPAEKDELVSGPHGEPFPIPEESQFDEAGIGRLAAPDLETIARRLIAIPDLKIGHLARFTVRVLWAKAGGTTGGKPKWGSVSLATSDDKFFSSEDGDEPFDAKIRLAADNLREAKATRWQVANELCFLLCRIGLYTTQEGGDERLTLVAPDASFFTPQMRIFGPQTPELKKTIHDIRQTRFDWAQDLAASIAANDAVDEDGDFDPTGHLPPAGEGEIGPVAGGAPDPDWADDLSEEAEQEERHIAIMRAEFGTIVTDDGVEVCRRCGVPAEDHPVDVCAGGVQEKPLKPDAKVRRTNSTTNGNGAQDDAFLLVDSDRVIHTLSQIGIQIVYVIPKGATVGQYQHPVTGEVYDTTWAESEYRAAISNTKREKAGAR